MHCGEGKTKFSDEESAAKMLSNSEFVNGCRGGIKGRERKEMRSWYFVSVFWTVLDSIVQRAQPLLIFGDF